MSTAHLIAVGASPLGKTDLPGRKQVFRRFNGEGEMLGDTIGLVDETLPGQALLEEVMTQGQAIGNTGATDLTQARTRCAEQLAMLPDEARRLRSPGRYPVALSEGLEALRAELAARH